MEGCWVKSFFWTLCRTSPLACNYSLVHGIFVMWEIVSDVSLPLDYTLGSRSPSASHNACQVADSVSVQRAAWRSHVLAGEWPASLCSRKDFAFKVFPFVS